MGEKLDDLEPFHPDRMASRILGMGDVLSLIEKAQETMDMEKAKALGAKLKKQEFDFEDFLDQMEQIQKMGSMDKIRRRRYEWQRNEQNKSHNTIYDS